MKTRTKLMLLLMLISLMACNSKQGSSEGGLQEAEVAEQTPQAPEMDIHAATFMGNLDAIRQHIAAGSDLNVKEPSVGSSPLISAAVFGKTAAAKLLIEAGADVNLQNNEGSTALHSAAFLCRTEIVKMLLDHGADKALLNNAGSTALQSVEGSFEDVRFIYDIFSRDLGPLGLKLDYKQLEETRPVIAEMLR